MSRQSSKYVGNIRSNFFSKSNFCARLFGVRDLPSADKPTTAMCLIEFYKVLQSIVSGCFVSYGMMRAAIVINDSDPVYRS